jgi:hypothetical protein
MTSWGIGNAIVRNVDKEEGAVRESEKAMRRNKTDLEDIVDRQIESGGRKRRCSNESVVSGEREGREETEERHRKKKLGTTDRKGQKAWKGRELMKKKKKWWKRE